MAIFIMTGKYSTDAVKQISGERTVKGNRIVQQCGGSIVSVYATLGQTDILVIAEFPGIGEAMKASVRFTQELGISFATTPLCPSRISTGWSVRSHSRRQRWLWTPVAGDAG